MAHAKITRVDVSPALQRPGVVAAFAGADLAELRKRLADAKEFL